MTSLAEQKATELYTALKGPTSVPNIDPLLLLALIALVRDLISVVKLCTKTSKEALDSGRNPGILMRMQMRSLIRRNLAEKEYGDINTMVEKIREVAWRTTVEEVSALQSEVQ